MVRQATYTNIGDPIIESVRTLIFKKSFRKDLKSFFSISVDRYASYGIFQKAIEGYSEFQRDVVPKTGGPEGFLNYFSLSEFIEDHSKVDTLKLEQLDYLFRIYFGILTLLLLFNMIHYAKVRLADPVKMVMLKMHFWFGATTSLFGKFRIHPANQ